MEGADRCCLRSQIIHWFAVNLQQRDNAAMSQQKRKRIEEPFCWGKTIGGLARPMLRGAARLGFKFILTIAACNLIRLPRLLAA